MASVILAGTPAALTAGAAPPLVLPNPITAESAAASGEFIAKWAGTSGAQGATNTGIYVAEAGTGSAGGLDVYTITGGAAQPQNTRWSIGTADQEAGANSGNDLAIYSYSDGGGYLGAPLKINRADGTTTLSPGFSAAQCGIAPLPTGAQTANVANAAVTANSVILCSMMGQEDAANVIPDGVVITPGVGFEIQLRGIVQNNPSTSSIAWFIAKF